MLDPAKVKITMIAARLPGRGFIFPAVPYEGEQVGCDYAIYTVIAIDATEHFITLLNDVTRETTHTNYIIWPEEMDYVCFPC